MKEKSEALFGRERSVTLFVVDPSSARAEAFLSAHPEIVVGSDFGVAEFSFATGDIDAGNRILRRLDINLRTPDAIHIAISRRLEATLVTFDRSMVAGARALGIAVATP